MSRVFLTILAVLFAVTVNSQSTKQTTKMNKLTELERYVILEKGTERPFTGEYYNSKGMGTYVCKQCDTPLYRSEDKFDSGCGWPSFDDEIDGAVTQVPDSDGRRTEIICTNCGGHLGHVFIGERFTEKNTRHCVNSISMKFIPAEEPSIQTAIYAGGCFWGVEHLMQQQDGVISVESGYIGGKTENPSYQDVLSHTTGHAEAVLVTFDPSKVSYETLTKLFFEIHDPTQVDRQGPDIGLQYRSEIFYQNQEQLDTAKKLIAILIGKGYNIATGLSPATKFYPAEEYHQDYYHRKGTQPYCHFRVSRF